MGNILSDDDIKSSISSSLCRVCGKASEGYKCPKCGKEADSFDPFHWKDCEHRAKMETKCKACQRAEGICTCLKHK